MVAIFGRADGVESVAEAATGEDALEMVDSYQPDLITLDLMLPGISGLDVLEELKGRNSTSKIVVLTNYPYPAFRKKCLAMGASHFFAKTVDPGQILDLVRNGGGQENQDDSQGEFMA
jgi:DNA-binding NarL/FixJ family response regulator